MPTVTARPRKWEIAPRLDLLRPLDPTQLRFRNLRRDPTLATKKFLGNGSYRTTYEWDAEWVLKIPSNQYGERDNIIEALLYAHAPKRRAKCELVDFNGVWALKMEKLENIASRWENPKTTAWPKWVTGETYDGYQCGYRLGTKEVLCYDYAFQVKKKREARKAFKWILDHYGTF